MDIFFQNCRGIFNTESVSEYGPDPAARMNTDPESALKDKMVYLLKLPLPPSHVPVQYGIPFLIWYNWNLKFLN